MSSVAHRPRWFFLITPKWLGWHAFAVVAAIGMLWLGDWQFHRAEGGNALSWAYTFEWPVFAIFGIVFWAKTIRDEFKLAGSPEQAGDGDAEVAVNGAAVTAAVPGTPLGRREAGGDEEPEDPELAAYNAYLAQLNDQVRGHGRWHGLR
jgi:hypothetical protein